MSEKSCRKQNSQYAFESAASWLSTPVVLTGDKKIRKSRSTKPILHPIFAECASQTSDLWWKEKFMSAAYGKMPSKLFTFKDGIMIYSKKNNSKPHTLEVPISPYEAFYACKEFFMTHAQMISPTDHETALEERRKRGELEAEEEPKTWGEFSKKMRGVLIEYYIDYMSTVLKLTAAEQKNLRYRIYGGIGLGFLSKDSFHIEDGRITQIDGLYFNELERFFFVDETQSSNQGKSRSSGKKNKSGENHARKGGAEFEARWLEYLGYLDRKSRDMKVSRLPVLKKGEDFGEESDRSEQNETSEASEQNETSEASDRSETRDFSEVSETN